MIDLAPAIDKRYGKHFRRKTVIEDVDKYIDPKEPDDIDKVRESVMVQFGPDYCVIPSSSAFRMLLTYYLLDTKGGISSEGATMVALLHGGIIKDAVVGAGFSCEDATQIIAAIKKDAFDD